MIDVEGVTVPRVLVLELAETLQRDGYFDTANHLLGCLAEDTRIELGPTDTRVILQLLTNRPEDLEELREALLKRL